MQSPDSNTKLTWTSHAVRLVDITPGDTTFNPPLRLIRLNAGGTLGNIEVVAADDPDSASQVFAIDADHPIVDIAVKKVLAAGTTATGLVGGR